MRKLLVAAALLGASCATPSLLVQRTEGAPERPLRMVVLQRVLPPSVPSLGIGTEMVMWTEEAAAFGVADPRPLVLRPLEPVALPSFDSPFGAERRTAFVPTAEAHVQAVFEKP